MTKKIYVGLFAVICMAIGMSSCDDDWDKWEMVTAEAVRSDGGGAIPYLGGKGSVSVTSNGCWELKGIPEWVHFSKTEGKGDATLEYEIDKNAGKSSRSGSVLIEYNGTGNVAGSKNQSIRFFQKSLSDEFTLSLAIDCSRSGGYKATNTYNTTLTLSLDSDSKIISAEERNSFLKGMSVSLTLMLEYSFDGRYYTSVTFLKRDLTSDEINQLINKGKCVINSQEKYYRDYSYDRMKVTVQTNGNLARTITTTKNI